MQVQADAQLHWKLTLSFHMQLISKSTDINRFGADDLWGRTTFLGFEQCPAAAASTCALLAHSPASELAAWQQLGMSPWPV